MLYVNLKRANLRLDGLDKIDDLVEKVNKLASELNDTVYEIHQNCLELGIDITTSTSDVDQTFASKD